MLVIGLTGPTGSGKGVVADCFAAYGLPILNADTIYHELLIPPSPCLSALAEQFGNAILNADGRLDRRALSEIVFSDPASLSALNSIAHRYVMQEIRCRLEALRRRNTPAAVLDAPQLFEAGADRDCNVIVSVLADPAIRMERIMQRDGISAEQAKRRMAAQKSEEFFRSHSNYILENNRNPEALRPLVGRILFETGVLQA